MDWLSLIGGILGGQGGQQGGQTPGSEFNPYARTGSADIHAPVTNFGGGGGGEGGQSMMPPVFGIDSPARTPGGIESQQAQLQNPGMPDAQFGQYVYEQSPGVLPPPPMDPPGVVQGQDMQYQSPQMAGPVSTPMGAPSFMNMLQGVNPQGAQGAPPAGQQPPQQVGFGDLFDMTGTTTDPNIFVKLAEGYNRGGLLGALGYGLTKF